MELPKNITQIGEVGKDCKVYVEDYVISYIKQLNHMAENRETAVSLYGRLQVENGVSYYFVYGACKLDFLRREVRHLSQAQHQEIERLRRKFFPELSFLGYRLLDGEMIEGFHICDQDICRYLPGYAQFYEKNDAMLAYMLAERNETKPEQVNQEKYDEVKRRQEERRIVAETAVLAQKKSKQFPSSANLQKMRLTAVGVFALLCLFGIATFREETPDNIVAGQNGAETVSGIAVQGKVEKDTLVMEDKLESALLEENRIEMQPTTESAQETEAEEQTAAEEVPETEASADEAATETEAVSASVEPAETVPKAVAYVIQPGDTLIAISLRQYGTDTRVSEICSANKIKDPDNIKEGQVIMLPQ